MLDLHFLKECNNFRHKLKVILEQLTFEHCRKVFWNLISFLETTFQVISNFSNVRNIVVFWILVVTFGELELNFFSQEELDHEIHDFLVFFRLKVIIIEHVDTTADHQTPAALVQMNSTHRLVAGICQGTRCQNGVRRRLDSQRRTIDKHEIRAHSFRLLLVLFFLLVPSPEHEHVLVSALRLFRVSVDNSSNFFIQDSVVNVRLFWMEILVE